MARLGIAPPPANFAVWYHHCAGRLPELSRVLTAIEKGGESFSEERSAAIFEHFFGGAQQSRLIDETCARVTEMMGRLLEQIGGFSRRSGEYRDQLATFDDVLARSDEPMEVQALVEVVVSATRMMQHQVRQLETGLDEAARHVADLRKDLARARRQANIDPLTGIANRKRFDEVLRAAAAKAARAKEPLSLLLIDIDHFKSFNDRYGHQVGDRVLQAVAQLLVRSVKGRDLPARYGGEEFAVVLPQTHLDGAMTVAEQVRAAVAGNHVRLKSSGQSLGTISVSIGSAEHAPDEPLSALIERADQALYRAKSEGRNRVVAAAPPARRGSAA